AKLVQEIEMELDGAHFGGWGLTPADIASLRRVLQCELELSGRETYLSGSSHLCARLLLANGKDEARTLGMVVQLEARLRPYWGAGSATSPLRNDILL